MAEYIGYCLFADLSRIVKSHGLSDIGFFHFQGGRTTGPAGQMYLMYNDEVPGPDCPKKKAASTYHGHTKGEYLENRQYSYP